MTDTPEAFSNLKKEIRSILIPQQKGCTLRQFRKDYREMLGRDFPYRDFHFRDDLDLLNSIPDVVSVFQSGGDWNLMAVADETTSHIQKMVAKQKPAKHKPTKNKNPPRHSSYSSRPASRQSPFSRNSGKPASYANYATSATSRPSSSASQSAPSHASQPVPVRTMPSHASNPNPDRTVPFYASQYARAGFHSFREQPVPFRIMPSRASNPNPDRTVPSYASQSARAGSNSFAGPPVPGRSVPSSQPVPVANRPVPIAQQSVPSGPVFPGSASCQAAKRPPAAAMGPPAAATGGWSGQSEVPQRFRTPSSFVDPVILPPDVECRIVNLVRTFTTGLRMSDFPSAYQKHFQEMFSWDKHGFVSLKQCLDSIPDLGMQMVNNDFVIYYVDNMSLSKPSSAQQPTDRQTPGKLVDFDFPTKPSPASEQNKAVEVFQFTGSWTNEKPMVKLDQFNWQPTPKQNAWNQAAARPIFPSFTDSCNLKSNSPLDEKSQYYQDSAVFKNPHSVAGTPKTRADVLDTFELSSTSSLGITDKTKKNMREIMLKNKNGIFATEFPAVYERLTGSPFDLHSLGFTDLSELVDALPDIFRRKRTEGSRWILVPAGEEVADSPKKTALEVECSIQNIRRILEAFPEGIQLSEFLNVYRANLNEPLYIIDLGFSCIDDFLLSISEMVPLKIETVEGIKTVFLAEEKEEVLAPIEDIPTAIVPNFPVYEEQESIPFDAASPDCQYRLLQLPVDFDRTQYVPVYTSHISHPGHLFVQLGGYETTEALAKLGNDLDEFYYGDYSHQYQLKRRHLRELAMCAAMWPQKTQGRKTFGDNKWYRALIIGHQQDSAKVFYVDYGTTDEIPFTMLRYLKEAFTKLPAQALKARLAHLKPPNNAPRFSPESKDRMLELCMDTPLMAKVEEDKDGILSLILCDTRGDTDVYINDTLMQEGLAVSVVEPALLPQQALQLAQWQMYNSLSLNPEEVSRRMQHQLTLSDPLMQHIPPPTASPPALSSDESEIFQDDDDLFEEFYQKASSVSKRYVKRVRTSDGYVFHVLVVEEGAYVSSGDVSTLVWSDKSPQYLLERLQTRDIVFPSHCISEKGNEAMFHQFEKFQVKGIQNNGDYKSIIIYPLKSTIPILNVYGHPSLELRHKIMTEMESFNPHLPAWQEVSEVEMSEEEVVFRAVTDDDKLRRLCIHDLMAMKEGIRQKRNTLVHRLERDAHCGASTVDELDKLEGLLKRVVTRIQQIKQICATFS